MEGLEFKIPEIPAKVCLDGRRWAHFFFFFQLSSFPEKSISRGDLGQHLLEKL